VTTYYVGTGGNNSNSGLSYALRRLTLTSIETLVAAGDIVYVAPGTYRESLTATTSGGSAYTTGTVSVTNGSAVVTGSGTSWLANAFANGQFQLTSLASGSDGVANGTTTFTSAAGAFAAKHIGMVLNIATKGAYTITAVASATSITLSGSPSAGTVLGYSTSVPAPIEILSVDSDTQITLKAPFPGGTSSGISYITYKDIKYIADVLGTNTDGVGGQVRITGSDDDLVATRNFCITATSVNYRTFRGFVADITTGACCGAATSTNWIFEDCGIKEANGDALVFSGANQLNHTIRRCFIYACVGSAVDFTHSATVSNSAHITENCIFWGNGSAGVISTRIGGFIVRNCLAMGNNSGYRVITALASGQVMMVNNSIALSNVTGLRATTTAEVASSYNDSFLNGSGNYSTVTAGANDVQNAALLSPPLLFATKWLMNNPFIPGSQSSLRSVTGIGVPYDDFYGRARSSPSSWGAIEYIAGNRPSDSGEPRGRRGNLQ